MMADCFVWKYMNKRILVIDDDVDILDALSTLLEISGFQVNTTAKGTEVYAKVKACKPDIILLDVLLSGSDGRTICKKLKDNPETKDIPLIMMSAHPSAKRASLDCGANDFIPKPFEVADLLQTIETYSRQTSV